MELLSRKPRPIPLTSTRAPVHTRQPGLLPTKISLLISATLGPRSTGKAPGPRAPVEQVDKAPSVAIWRAFAFLPASRIAISPARDRSPEPRRNRLAIEKARAPRQGSTDTVWR